MEARNGISSGCHTSPSKARASLAGDRLHVDTNPGNSPPSALAGDTRPMKVAELLSRKGTRILTARMDETVETAARLLSRENVGALVVKDSVGTEGDTVVGMFSERDLLHAMVEHGAPALKKPVAALMSKKVISCAPGDDLRAVLDLMDRHYIRHVPVLDGTTLIGVVSIRDFIALRLKELTD
jgi:CBS domain-containing protein